MKQLFINYLLHIRLDAGYSKDNMVPAVVKLSIYYSGKHTTANRYLQNGSISIMLGKSQVVRGA